MPLALQHTEVEYITSENGNEIENMIQTFVTCRPFLMIMLHMPNT